MGVQPVISSAYNYVYRGEADLFAWKLILSGIQDTTERPSQESKGNMNAPGKAGVTNHELFLGRLVVGIKCKQIGNGLTEPL